MGLVDWEAQRGPLASRGIDLDDPKVREVIEAFDDLDERTQRGLISDWRRILGVSADSQYG